MKTLDSNTVAEFARGLTGDVVQPGDAGYDDARGLWNAMIDKRPALIVRCAATSDVVQAVRFARVMGLVLAVRGGGHNIAGSGSCDGGLVVDLSHMRAVTVDAAKRRARVEGGALLSDVDAATQAHGLATPLGINSTTGVGGLTLGGGFGWLSRKYGMTVDNLVAAEVVTASGDVLEASAEQHADLFWALRGGGGNFGVVTRFEFQLHRVGPEVLSGLIAYPLAEAKGVLQRYREFMTSAPEELNVWSVLRQAPPLPFLPPAVHGTGIVVLAFAYFGDPEQGRRLVEPLRHFGAAAGEFIGVQPYVAWQQTFDPLLTHGARNYWKSHNLAKLEDGLLDAVIDSVARVPSGACEIFFGAVGGATARPAVDATAYPHRDARYVMNVHGRWETPAEDAPGVKWAREFFAASAPFASAGVYVNFLTEEEGARVHSAYGVNYDRLARVKRQYDPENLFRTNWNVVPA